MYILSNRDIELSCDETVVRSFGDTTKSAYARTLISMEEKKNALTPLCNNFSKNAIEERITAIVRMKKTSVVAALVALVLIIAITTAFATSAAAPDKKLTSIPNTNFSQSDYDQLLAFCFDGYEKMTVSDANRLTVGEYEQARKGIMDGMQQFLKEKANAELQDEKGMDAAILEEIATLKSKWETSFLKIAVEYHYIPLSLYESPFEYISNSYEEEKRSYPHASKADYQSLLRIKTAGYQDLSVSAFNAALLEWANENYERNERVNIDRAWNDFEVALTNEERSFVTLTVRASGEENAKLVQSHYTGREKEDPILGNFDLTKEVNDNNTIAWANLFYQIPYHITDDSKLTIGERDRALAGVINEIQQYWDNADIDTLSIMKGDSILKEFKAIAEKYSNDLIEISFTNNNVSFECMSEPKARD